MPPTVLALSVSFFLVSLAGCPAISVPPGDECGSDGICEDDNPCTVNVCGVDAVCVTSPADDGLTCGAATDPTSHRCLAGKCTPHDALCPAATDPCQENGWSVEKQACEQVARPDGTTCGEGSVCADGVCTAPQGCGEPGLTCDDGNPCTDDACVDKVCAFVASADGELCDDGQSCTQGDACVNGSCVGTVACEDNNPCTNDACVDDSCVHEPLTGTDCDDDDACTVNDICDDSGACAGTSPCTSSECQVPTGCDVAGGSLTCHYLKFQNVPCDDGVECTVGDVCVAGACEAGPETSCDDGDPCTEDACDASANACSHTGVPGCTKAICKLSGEVGDVISCPLYVARTEASQAPATSLQLTLEYDASVATLDMVMGTLCVPGGPCIPVPLVDDGSGGTPSNTPNGHAVSLYPQAVADWNTGLGSVSLANAGTPTAPVSELLYEPLQPPPEESMTLTFEFKLTAQAAEASPVTVTSITAVQANGSLLVSAYKEKVVVTCDPLTCATYYIVTGTPCADEPIEDGCGGTLTCPCQDDCAPETAESLCPTVGAEKLAKPPHTGDINNDGELNISDINCYVSKHFLLACDVPGCMELSVEDADLDCDGVITVADVQVVLNRVLFVLTGDPVMQNVLLANDADLDLLTNACDEDDDNDLWPDTCEYALGTDPYDPLSVPDLGPPPEGTCAQAAPCIPPYEGHCVGDDGSVPFPTITLELYACSKSCESSEDPLCIVDCLVQATGLSNPCAICYGTLDACADAQCATACGQVGSDECNACVALNCGLGFTACAGYLLPW